MLMEDLSDPTDHSVVQKLRIIMSRIVESVMKPSTLPPANGAVDDEGCGRGEIAEFEKVGGDFEVPVELLDLGLQITQAGGCPLEPLVGADDADVIPHQSANLVPIVINHNEFVDILDLPRTPLGEADFCSLMVMVPARLGLSPMGHDKCLQQGVAG